MLIRRHSECKPLQKLSYSWTEVPPGGIIALLGYNFIHLPDPELTPEESDFTVSFTVHKEMKYYSKKCKNKIQSSLLFRPISASFIFQLSLQQLAVCFHSQHLWQCHVVREYVFQIMALLKMHWFLVLSLRGVIWRKFNIAGLSLRRR